MTSWVGRLIFANILAMLLVLGSPALYQSLAYQPYAIMRAPWTLVTYMFVHGGFMHLFFNMFSLWIFGPRVEVRLGGARFLGLYFGSGLAAALMHSVFSPYEPIIGASGACFGVTYAFAHYWPREPIYLWAVLKLEAWTLVILLTVLELYNGIKATDNIAHFAHLGGFLGGYVYLKWVDRTSPAAKWRAKVAPPPPPAPLLDQERWKRANLSAMHPVNREEYERVLAKLQAIGVQGLTRSEIEFLERFSRMAS